MHPIIGTLYIDLAANEWDSVSIPIGQPADYVELSFTRGNHALSKIVVDPTTGRVVRSWDYHRDREGDVSPRERAERDEIAIAWSL